MEPLLLPACLLCNVINVLFVSVAISWLFCFFCVFFSAESILAGVPVLENGGSGGVAGHFQGRVVRCAVWALPEVAESIVVVSCPWKQALSHGSCRNLLPALIRQTDPASFLCQIPGVIYNKISGLEPMVVSRAFSFISRQMFGEVYFSEYRLYEL